MRSIQMHPTAYELIEIALSMKDIFVREKCEKNRRFIETLYFYGL